jgi:hypothetical protein
MTVDFEFRHLTATLIFDLEDSYARGLGTVGKHPRPLGRSDFYAVGSLVGGNRQPVNPALRLLVSSNPGGYHLFFGKVASADRRPIQVALGSGDYFIRVVNEFYQPLEQKVTIPTFFAPAAPSAVLQAPYFFDLAPGYAYPFPGTSTLSGGQGPTLLRGALRNPDGTGVAGAKVEVTSQPGIPPYQSTDTSGQWVLVFPDSQPAGNVALRITLPNGSVQDLPNVPIQPGRGNSLPQTALRGWVQTSTGAGIAGATIQISTQPGQAMTGDDGSWFYYLSLTQAAETVDASARTPDGRTMTEKNILVQPRATAVVPTFRFQ